MHFAAILMEAARGGGMLAGTKERTQFDLTGQSGATFVTAGPGRWIQASNATQRVVFWFNTGTESDPGGGDISVEVTITPVDDESTVTAAFMAAADANGFSQIDGNTIEDDATGPRADATDDTTFPSTPNILVQGS